MSISNIAYIVNESPNNISICDINPTTGTLSCPTVTGNGLDQPIDITINSTSTWAYITNYNSNTVSLCSIAAGTMTLTCANSTTEDVFNNPRFIALG